MIAQSLLCYLLIIGELGSFCFVLETFNSRLSRYDTNVQIFSFRARMYAVGSHGLNPPSNLKEIFQNLGPHMIEFLGTSPQKQNLVRECK